MELEKMGVKTGLGTAHLMNLRKHASFLIRDGLKIARLAFVDVSAAELATEDATNAEEWGPTTKTMASISDAAYSSEDYMRIVQVLHGRFALNGKKYWRQVYKSLTLLEYLLTHGPDQLVMEFREDKDRIEEFTRLVYVDENLVDRGSVVQKKATQVRKLLMDEKFYKEERRRALKISKGILGFGSQSLCQRPASRPPKGPQADDNSLRVNGDSHPSIRPSFQKSYTHPGTFTREPDKGLSSNDLSSGVQSESEPSSPTSQSSWSAFSTSSAGDSPNTSSAASTTSTDWNPFDESPTSAQSCPSPSSPITGGWAARSRTTSPVRKISQGSDMSSTASSKNSELPVKSKAEAPRPQSPPLIFKLPPPPALAAYKCTVPPPPPGGSKVGRHIPRCHKPAQAATPDLIDL